jgi:hypothetical protein
VGAGNLGDAEERRGGLDHRDDQRALDDMTIGLLLPCELENSRGIVLSGRPRSAGAIVLQSKGTRAQLERRLMNISLCLIGMEACSGAHHIGRQLEALGHEVRRSRPLREALSQGAPGVGRNGSAGGRR